MTREQTPRNMYITRDLIWPYGPTAGCPKCRSLARGDSINPTLPHSRACRERVEGLVGSGPVSRDRSSLADERRTSLAEEGKTRNLAEHLERKFGASGSSSKSDARSGGRVSATPGTDGANAHDVQDRTSASSNSVVPPESGEPGTDECPANKCVRSWVSLTRLWELRRSGVLITRGCGS